MMARPATGQVVERRGKRGRAFALRFRAYGERRYVTLGTTEEGWTEARTEVELQNVLADVRRGTWRPPPEPQAVELPAEVPTFHRFASDWLMRKQAQGLGARTIDDYRWALELHLLPHFAGLRLDRITKKLVDDYAAAKQREGVLATGTINKTLVRLAQILGDAVEYDLIAANPAAGRRRRLKASKPRRPWVEPEQLMALLEGAEPLLHGRGRPLLATLAGAGLRIQEALDLRWGDVSLPRGTLTVRRSKTDAGVRVVDLTPALREELVLWRNRSKHTTDGDLAFPTLRGGADNRQNVRRRLLLPAIEKANHVLIESGIEPIGSVGLHGLRRTFASLRLAVGDDPVYTAAQLGHEDALFTMRVYAAAVKRRDRLTPAERKAFDRAVEWARMGTNALADISPAPSASASGNEETRRFQRVS
jgi:integrase